MLSMADKAARCFMSLTALHPYSCQHSSTGTLLELQHRSSLTLAQKVGVLIGRAVHWGAGFVDIEGIPMAIATGEERPFRSWILGCRATALLRQSLRMIVGRAALLVGRARYYQTRAGPARSGGACHGPGAWYSFTLCEFL